MMDVDWDGEVKSILRPSFINPRSSMLAIISFTALARAIGGLLDFRDP
jgi:hypothetical protein